MKTKYYSVVPAFGKQTGGYMILLFKKSDNMAQGAVDENFADREAAEGYARVRGWIPNAQKKRVTEGRIT